MLDRDMDIHVDSSLLPTLEDEGELLPSAAHPSYPTGRPRRNVIPYVSEPKLSPLLHNNLALLNGTRGGGAGHSGRGMGEGGDKDANEGSEAALKKPLVELPAHLALRAATDVAPHRSAWPFKAYGPGPGGASSLQRFEQRHPQRAEREIWADLGLSEFLPRGREGDPLRSCVGDARHELPDFGGVDADASQAIASLAAEGGTSTDARQRASLLLDSGISRAETARRELQRLEAELDHTEALGHPTDELLDGWTDFELHAGRMEARWGATRPSMRLIASGPVASSHAVGEDLARRQPTEGLSR
ncbi:hypothetical protein CBOM_03233 [Ceraceosorus bombacis]|uniref:Uncharacterized protein n=1 Tax=Ceraceosorus bombacis TaxID=401625 RepID=A0A0P1BL10_9BASI|nr:hypothetical protein CBOM_03233 [Ceraceosorus bombacis]